MLLSFIARWLAIICCIYMICQSKVMIAIKFMEIKRLISQTPLLPKDKTYILTNAICEQMIGIIIN